MPDYSPVLPQAALKRTPGHQQLAPPRGRANAEEERNSTFKESGSSQAGSEEKFQPTKQRQK